MSDGAIWVFSQWGLDSSAAGHDASAAEDGSPDFYRRYSGSAGINEFDYSRL